MNKVKIEFLVFLFLICLCNLKTHSQERSIDYVLGPPETLIDNSQYNRFIVIDNREDTTQVGFTLTGAFNRLALLVPEVDIKQQIHDFFSSAINPDNASNGELVILIRNWQFSESSGNTSEKGFFNLRLSFFAKKGDKYFLLTTFTRRISISKIEVSKAIRKSAKAQLVIGAKTALKSVAEIGIPYNYSQLRKIEEYEKDEVSVLNVPEFTDGLYLNYNSFTAQKPEWKVKCNLEGDKISKVQFQNKEGNWLRWNGESEYAVVYNGKAFIHTKTGYYPIKRVNRKLQFVGLMPKMGNAANISFGIVFGLVGMMLTPSAKEWYLVEIDHIDGGFNYIRYANHMD